MSPRTRHFLKNVPAGISRTLVSELSKGSKPIPPKILEDLAGEERIALIVAIQLLVTERKIKTTKVIMRSLVFIAILAASVIANPRVAEVMSEPLYEFLKVFFVE